MQKHLIVEEFKEFLEAEQLLLKDFTRNKEDCLKELADLVYVCYQYAANMGWDLDEAMDRVHKSNMSKLDDNGQPIFREDGKVLKSPNYQPPTLTDLV
jgi:predicted HAD superfamily Cof-like phosphohydrolase